MQQDKLDKKLCCSAAQLLCCCAANDCRCMRDVGNGLVGGSVRCVFFVVVVGAVNKINTLTCIREQLFPVWSVPNGMHALFVTMVADPWPAT